MKLISDLCIFEVPGNRKHKNFTEHLQSMQKKTDNWHTLTYSEKVRWCCQNPNPAYDYRVLVDKYLVKKTVEPYFKVAKPYLAVEDIQEICIDNLPDTFVMKATHGWNMCLLIENNIVMGGNRKLTGSGIPATTKYLQQVAAQWLMSEQEVRRHINEKHYSFVKPGILLEQFLEPVDYELQLFLFNGKCHLTMVFFRNFYHQGATHRLYNSQWHQLDPGSKDSVRYCEKSATEVPPPPQRLLQKLLELCQSIDHVRADFYVVNGEYYFSEFTFSHNGGRGAGFIGKYDAALGRLWLG